MKESNSKRRSKRGTDMKDTETRNRFVELRAQGLSFAKIAQTLEVSKQTLINWSKELQNEITNLKEVELEELRDRHNMSERTRIELIGGQLERIKEELAKRDLSDVPTATLLSLFIKFAPLLEKEHKPVCFVQDVVGMGDLTSVFTNRDEWTA